MTGVRTAADRTPKPCLHKIASHQHGTRVCYVADKCRCEPCTEANRVEQGARRLQQAYGRYDRLVDADPVRRHVEALRAQGMGIRRIAAAAGVTRNSICQLFYGKSLQNGSHRAPARRIAKTNADRLLAVTFTPPPAAEAEAGYALGAARRIQALVALGWSLGELGRRLGNDALPRIVVKGGLVTVAAAERIAALYDELSMTLPPARTRFEKASLTRSLAYAAARGWQPPLAIDDETLDDDFEGGQILIDVMESDLDEIAIERRMGGEKTIRLSKAEKVELYRRWVASGRPLNELERVTGINSSRYKEAS